MQHLAFDDDRRRLLRPSVIPDDAISVFARLQVRLPLFYLFRYLAETPLEFNNLAGGEKGTFLSSIEDSSENCD